MKHSQEWHAAREDLIDRLLEGRSVDGVSMADILDAGFDANTRTEAAEVSGLLLEQIAFARDEHTYVERRVKIQEFLRARAGRWLDAHPEPIRERAWEFLHDPA